MKNFVLAIAVSAAVLLFGGVSFAVDYDSADYFPLEVDNEWIYNDGADDSTNAVTGIHEPSGAYVYTYGMDGSARYYTNDGTGLLMHGIYDDFFGGDPASIEFLSPLEILPPSFTEIYSDSDSTTFEMDTPGIGVLTYQAEMTTEVKSVGPITNSDGVTIYDVIEVQFDFHAYNTTYGIDITSSMIYWFKEGVGPVKASETYGGDDPDINYLQEFASYYDDTGYEKCYYDVTADGEDVLCTQYNEPFYNEGGGDYSGRLYIESGVDPDGHEIDDFTYAYILNTDNPLIVYEANMSDVFGGGTIFFFYDSELSEKIAGRVEMDNGAIAEIRINESTDENKLTKLEMPDGSGGYDTYWFLWGDVDINGSTYTNVVIKQAAGSADYIAYHGFNADPDNPDNVIGNLENDGVWTHIGVVADPLGLTLPNLGDWWQYCFDSHIVPEFPPLTTIYHDEGQDGIINYRIDTNDAMITTYGYTWDVTGAGEVQVDMKYNYNGDSVSDLIYSEIYAYNDVQDPRLSSNWTFVTGIYYEYYISGNLRAIEYSNPPGDTIKTIYYNEASSRPRCEYKTDGTILLYAGYHGATDVPTVVQEYDSGWNLLTTYEYYASSNLKSMEWANPAGGDKRYVYYDEAESRKRATYRTDGTIRLYTEYHGTTSTPKTMQEYDSSWNLTRLYQYHESGNLKSIDYVNPTGTIQRQAYYDEAFYGNVGRLRCVYETDGDIYLFTSYHGDTDTRKTMQYYDSNWNLIANYEYHASGQLKSKEYANPPGDVRKIVYYDEDFFGDKGRTRCEYKRDGTILLYTEYYTDSAQARYVEEYDSNWNLIATYEYDDEGNLLGASSMYMQEILARLDIESTAASNFSDQFIGELADQPKTEGLIAQ